MEINWLQGMECFQIFTESKDEVSLVLFGCDETKNSLAEEDQYQNISVVRDLQLPDFDFIKMVQSEIRCTDEEADCKYRCRYRWSSVP